MDQSVGNPAYDILPRPYGRGFPLFLEDDISGSIHTLANASGSLETVINVSACKPGRIAFGQRDPDNETIGDVNELFGADYEAVVQSKYIIYDKGKMKTTRIAVIGGGFSGLTLGYDLAKAGYQVTVFEKEEGVGGLAGGIKRKNWRWSLDYFYRHVFSVDRDFIKLAEELGVGNKVIFRRPKTSVLFKEQIFPFDSPKDILLFPGLTVFSRIRLGFGMAVMKYLPYSRGYEKVRIEKLRLLIGDEAYQKIWRPLLEQKFGRSYSEVPLSWFWARIKARTPKLGYFQGSFLKMANLLVTKIKEMGGRVKVGFKTKLIKRIGKEFVVYGNNKNYVFDKVVLATPLPVSMKIGEEIISGDYSRLGTEGAVVLTLRLKNKFFPDNTYWLNILDKDWPFVAAVEHTNFMDSKNYNGEIIVYLGGYYHWDDPIFKMSKEEILNKFLPFAKRINPEVGGNIVGSELHVDLYAQPLPITNYSNEAPRLETGTVNAWWLTMHHIYPWDRGVNFAIRYARMLGTRIIKKDAKMR